MRAAVAKNETWESVEAAAMRFASTSSYIHKLVKGEFDATLYAAVGAVDTAGLPPLPPHILDRIYLTASKLDHPTFVRNIKELSYCAGLGAKTADLVETLRLRHASGVTSQREFGAVARSMPPHCAQLLGVLIRAVTMACQVQVHELPIDHVLGQLRSLQFRYGIADMRLEMRLEQVEHQGLLNCAVHGQPVVTRNDDVEIVDAQTDWSQCDRLQMVTLELPPDSLPEGAGDVFFCPMCGGFKAFVADKHPLHLHAVGTPNVVFDYESDRLRCCCKKRRFGLAATEVVRINLVGRAIRFQGSSKWYTHCTRCATVCEWDIRKCKNGQFGCGLCEAEDRKLVLIARRRGVHCVFCMRTHNQWRNWIKVTVVDDSVPGMPLRQVNLCNQHACFGSGPSIATRCMMLSDLITYVLNHMATRKRIW